MEVCDLWLWETGVDEGKEVGEGEHEGVLPLTAEVHGEHGIRLGAGEERDGEPILPI